MPRNFRVRFASAALACATIAGSLVINPTQAQAANNGVALTPPMGWSSWNAFRCNITEGKIRAMADAMVKLGLKDAGYTYINIDDCWQASTRDANGNLRGDPKRFPSGMKALADYIHSKGLKAGIYATPGTRTCANIWDKYPGKLGSLGHEQQDANTFAKWGYDFLKYDWCKADDDGQDQQAAFTKMARALKKTGRPIVYSIHTEPELPVLAWEPTVANMWRTTPDIQDNWRSMIGTGLINLFGQRYQRPGAWNDADMLEVGNGGMTYREYRTHMTLWSIMGSPLMIGTDLRKLHPSNLGLLNNPYMTAVNQDPLGAAAQTVYFNGQSLIVVRRLTYGRVAVAIFNLFGQVQQNSLWFSTLTQHGLKQSSNYLVTDVWGGYNRLGKRYVDGRLEKHDSIFYIVTPVTARQVDAFKRSEAARKAHEKAETKRIREDKAQAYSEKVKAQKEATQPAKDKSPLDKLFG